MPFRRLMLTMGSGLILLAGCPASSSSDGPQMDPGQSCLTCHGPGGLAADSAFNLAGTIFPMALASANQGLAAATISLVDATGQKTQLTSNAAGNFYTSVPLTFPVTVSAAIGGTTFTMQQTPLTGDCNSCHGLQASVAAPLPPGDAGFSSSPGRLYAFAAGCPSLQSGCATPAPSFAAQVAPILQGTCLPCHLAPGQCATAYLDGGAATCGIAPELDSYATISTADFSTTFGCRMPPPGTFLVSPDELQILSNWLACGAPNN